MMINVFKYLLPVAIVAEIGIYEKIAGIWVGFRVADKWQMVTLK
jgi:hypothetical protein